MGRRLAPILVVALLAGGPPAAAPTTARQSGSQATLLSEVITKGVTLERGKLYFSLAVRTLPGVSVDGITPDPSNFEGTAAHLWHALHTTQDPEPAPGRRRRTRQEVATA